LAVGAAGSLSAAENAVLNPGFEETDAAGVTAGWPERKPVYRFQDGVGRAGSRGLAFENADPKYYSFPTQTVGVKPGCCYRFEVWVRTEALTGDESGATVCLEWAGPAGKWMGGAYAEGVSGTSDGWKLVSGVTPPIPTNVTRVTVAPYVRRGMTGKAWFDDLRVAREYPPLVTTVSASCYRHTAEGGPVTFTAGLTLREAGVRVADVDGAFTLRDAGGAVVRTAKPVLLTDDRASFTLDASELAVGEYAVAFALATRDGASTGKAETPFSRVAKLPARRVFIDAQRRLIVDGQPFFPLGMYWSGVKEPELETYAQGPFNCLMPYGSPNPQQMDACQARGLKVIYSIKDFYSGTRWAPAHMKTEADEAAEIEKRVGVHRNHAALLAWYINDELPLTMVDRLAARQRLMERLDPDHPTWVVLYQYNQVGAYLATFDVIGTDPYPIPGKPAGTALEWTRVTRDQTYGTRPIWQVPQVFDWGAYRKGDEREKTRAPTLAEMRAMAWQCVAAGANGLVFYSFFDLFKMKDRDPFEKRWADVCAMAEEIKRHMPVLLSVEPAPVVSCEGSPAVETRAWRVGDDVYVLAVNGASEAVTATVTVGAPFGAANAEFGSPPVRDGMARLVYRFAPLEPVLVRLGK
jgi:hypothetical protein